MAWDVPSSAGVWFGAILSCADWRPGGRSSLAAAGSRATLRPSGCSRINMSNDQC